MAYTFQKVSPVFADEYHEGARRRAVSGAEGSREPQKGFVAQGLLGAGPERPGKRPKLAPAQVGTLRLRLLKLGARVESKVRRIVVHLPIGTPFADDWRRIARSVSPVVD